MKAVFTAIFGLMLAMTSAQAQTLPDDGESGLALPRFASLRSNYINARSGPGARYPIEWVYMQKSAPVEIIAEFESWRRIRDWQGSESWIKSSMLNRSRFAKVITPGESNLYAKSNYNAQIIARVEDEVIGEIKKCPANNDFCLLRFNQFEGWMPRQNIYGIYKDEIID